MKMQRHGRRAGRAVLPRAGLLLLSPLALAGCGLFSGDSTGLPPVHFPETATQVEYEVELVGAPNEEVGDILEETIDLYRRQEDGAPSMAILERRGEQDVEMIRKVLRSYGYYEPDIEIEVVDLGTEPAGAETAEPVRKKPAESGGFFASIFGEPDPDDVDQSADDGIPDQRALARVKIEPGPAFTLARHEFTLPERVDGPPLDLPPPAELGSPVGGQATAGAILDAEGQVLTRLINSGRPWAEVTGRRAVADLEADTLSVESYVEPGPYAEYGEVVVEGAEDVETSHILTYQPFEQGRPVDRRELRDYQSALMATGLYDAVTVDVPRNAPPEGRGPATPVRVLIEEGPRRTVTAGARYSTGSGPEVQAGFTHRNLFGAGERIEFAGSAGVEEQIARIDARKPQFLRPGQDLTGFTELRHIEDDAYDETGATLGAGLERQLDRYFTVGAGGLVEYSQITDSKGEEEVLLYGVPSFLRYDDTDDLLNPTEGLRFWLYGTPYYAQRDRGDSQFLRAEGLASTYIALDEERRYILAGRGRIGSIFSGEFDDIPATKRFYSGGGGSVRGYQERFIGPLDGDNDPTGGRSVAELGVEFRARIWGNIGAVTFLEAGLVSEELYPSFDQEPLYAGGVGLRYYSPVGPIRVDVAVPLNPRDVDDPFALYFSIGQAY